MGIDKNKNHISKKEYGDNYSQHFFEQYRIYLEGIEQISNRRDSANKYLITLNSGFLISIAFLIENIGSQCVLKIALSGICLLGIIISIIFYFLINSYKQLNAGKFEVLHEIESKLPLDLYKREWEILGKGNNYKKYFPFSHIEKLIPIFLGVTYLITGLIILFIL